ncbi:hypothetical protein OB13_15390, partial [Pontibacter sp. HJ8]
ESFSQKINASNQSIVKQLDASFNTFFPADQPGGVVLVVQNGNTVLRKGYGLADIDQKILSAPDRIYKIGSITKQFTAVSILLLEEEGKLKITDPLSKYLHDFPNAEKMTLEQLLNHTAGIRNYTSHASWPLGMHKVMTVEAMINTFKNEPLDFEPGTSFNYSNSGYILLGAVIEKVSGQQFGDFIEKKVLAKANMKKSYYGRDGVAVENAVQGFVKNSDTYTPARPISVTQSYAAGALLSTVDDLYKWNKALFNGKIIGQKSMAKAFNNYKLPNGKLTNYGFGWATGSVLGVRTLGHGGIAPGFMSYALMAPDQNTFVVVLTNNMTLQPEFVVSKALAIATGTYSEEKTITLSAAELEKYVGAYPVDGNTSRLIFIEDGKLFSQRTGSPAVKMVSVAKDEFLYKDSFTKATFKMENNKAVGMYFGTLNGEKEYFTKSDKAGPAPKKVVALTEAQLKKVAGRYELAPDFAIVVKLENGIIQAQATGQQAFEIFPTSEYSFFLKALDVQLEFLNGKDGEVTGLVLHQNGQKMPGKKLAD